MSAAQAKPAELADDGLPKVDVIELATALLHRGEGPRRATMVSTREVRAMAEAINNFNQLLSDAAHLLALIDAMADARSSLTRGMFRRDAEEISTRLQTQLKALGYMEGNHAEQG